ncbi:probable methyltransferase PMT7 [Telopea speciosissima]|uniref:probable methyltransferase PMT7 n=1 Tax=Telopea speciosissima TaxID=54955 RepID=UPI001CC4EFCF|nr:probable methyltransferase PMT7 [Telopea speciosissima]XP_043693647.1 probable methyltransferase PMT7 [Telopea speciosissima]
MARQVQTAIWIKQGNHSCQLQNAEQKLLNLCDAVDDSKPSWKIPLKNCIKLNSGDADIQKLPPKPQRLLVYTESLNNIGISQEKFILDTNFWKDQVHHYWRLMNISNTQIRNVMDMNAYWGGFAVALNMFPVWMMNVVPICMNNTLSAIYSRGLIGAFHDWCEPFSAYPRTYDLIHADHLLSHYKDKREGCLLEDIMLEMDCVLRPQGFIIIRDDASIFSRIKGLAPKFLWDVKSYMLEDKQKKMEYVLICRKIFWAIV